MNDECTITVAGDGQILIINLANLPVIKVGHLEKELDCSITSLNWLNSLCRAAAEHLGETYIRRSVVESNKVQFSLALREGKPVDVVKIYVEEFLSLSRWNITVKPAPAVRGSLKSTG